MKNLTLYFEISPKDNAAHRDFNRIKATASNISGQVRSI